MQNDRKVLATGNGVALVTGGVERTHAADAGLLSTPGVYLHVVGGAALVYSLEFHWRREGKERHFLLDVYAEVSSRETLVLSKGQFEALEAENALEGMPVHGPSERRMIDFGVSVLTPAGTETLRIKFTRSPESSDLLVMSAPSKQ